MIGTLKFELKLGVKGTGGKSPISGLYQVRGDRARFSPGITIYSIYWDNSIQRVRYIPQTIAKKLLPDVDSHQLLTKDECERCNATINQLKSDVENAIVKFVANDIQFTSKMVRDAVLNKQVQLTKVEEPKDLLFKFMELFIAENKDLIKEGSLSVYRSTLKHLKSFQQDTREQVKFESIDQSFFQRFFLYLINKKEVNKAGEVLPLLNNTTMIKITGTLKKFLNDARKKGIKVNDFSGFNIEIKPLEVIALTQDELSILLNLDLTSNLKLDRVRDLFCFACATGLRYSDVQQLEKTHRKGNIIEIVVVKTGELLTVPLSPISFKILEKYAFNESIKSLPQISNQKVNVYLTELCKLAGFNYPQEIVRWRGTTRYATTHPKHDLISFHTGRKTFVTLSLKLGMKETEVMTISGHRDYKSFKRYVHINKDHSIDAIAKAWGELERTSNT
jgi:integrase